LDLLCCHEYSIPFASKIARHSTDHNQSVSTCAQGWGRARRTYGAGFVDLAKGEIHKVVTCHKMSVERRAVLELDELHPSEPQNQCVIQGERVEGVALTIGLFCAAFSSDSGS
jgi:hypothetical protein